MSTNACMCVYVSPRECKRERVCARTFERAFGVGFFVLLREVIQQPYLHVEKFKGDSRVGMYRIHQDTRERGGDRIVSNLDIADANKAT